MTVEQDPDVTGFLTTNMPYVTVTICQPGGPCVQVDHVLVDTGSTGLRVFASALGGLSLPTVDATTGGPAGECADFLSGYMWGPVRLANVHLGGEAASNIPIQVVSDGSFPSAPSSCTGSGLTGYTSESNLGAKGIIGVDVFATDGQSYYDCSTASCTASTVATEVSNVVRGFAVDNNGVMLSMPAVAAGGQSTATGTLTFGVDTQPDNSQAGFAIIPEDAYGDFTATMNGSSYPSSITDSGSNFYFLNMPAGTPTTSQNFINPPAATTYPVVFQSNLAGGQSYSTSIELDPYSSNGMNALPNTGVEMNNAGMQIFGFPYFYGKTIALTYVGSPSNEGVGPLLGVQG